MHTWFSESRVLADGPHDNGPTVQQEGLSPLISDLCSSTQGVASHMGRFEEDSLQQFEFCVDAWLL